VRDEEEHSVLVTSLTKQTIGDRPEWR